MKRSKLRINSEDDEEDDDIFFFSSTVPSVTIRAPAYTINVVTPPPPIPITVKSSIHSIIPKPVVSIPVTSLITPITIKSFIPVNVKSTTHSIKPVVSVPVKQISTVINVEEAGVAPPTTTPVSVTSTTTPVSVAPTSTSTSTFTREVNIVSSLHTIKPVVSVPVKTTSTIINVVEKAIPAPLSVVAPADTETINITSSLHTIKPVVSVPVKTTSTLIKPVVSVPVKTTSTPIDINTPIIVNTSTVDISSANNSITIKEKQKETKDVVIKNRLHKINVKNSNWGIKSNDNWYYGLIPEKSISFIKNYKRNDYHQHYINTGGFYILFVKDDEIWVRHVFNEIQPIPLFQTLHNLGYSVEQNQQNQIFYSKKYDNEFITNNIHEIIEYIDFEKLYNQLKNDSENISQEMINSLRNVTEDEDTKEEKMKDLNSFLKSRGITEDIEWVLTKRENTYKVKDKLIYIISPEGYKPFSKNFNSIEFVGSDNKVQSLNDIYGDNKYEISTSSDKNGYILYRDIKNNKNISRLPAVGKDKEAEERRAREEEERRAKEEEERRAKEEEERRVKEQEERRAKEEEQRRLKEEEEKRREVEKTNALSLNTIKVKLNNNYKRNLSNREIQIRDDKIVSDITDSWSRTDTSQLQKTLEGLQILKNENDLTRESLNSYEYDYIQNSEVSDILDKLIQRVNTRILLVKQQKDPKLSQTVTTSKVVNDINLRVDDVRTSAVKDQTNFIKSTVLSKPPITINARDKKEIVVSLKNLNIVNDFRADEENLLCIGLKYEVQAFFSLDPNIKIKIEYSINNEAYKSFRGKIEDEKLLVNGVIQIFQKDIIDIIGKGNINSDLGFKIIFDNTYSTFTSKTVNYELYTI